MSNNQPLLFNFQFDFYYGNSWPEIELASAHTNLKVSENQLSEYKKTVTYQFKSTSTTITFKNKNKKDSDTVIEDGKIVRDQYASLTTMLVDDILLDPTLIQNYVIQTPEYSKGYLDYCQANQIVVNSQTNEYSLYFNGTISFTFENPFWNWYANIRKQQILNNFNKDQIELFFGVNTTVDALLPLKAILNNWTSDV